MIEERCRTLADQFSVAREAYERGERLDRIQRAADRVKELREIAEQASGVLTTLSSGTTDPEARAGIEDAMIGTAKARRGLEILWKQLRADENLLVRGNHDGYRAAFAETNRACSELGRAAEQTWRDHARSCLSDDSPILDVFQESNEKPVENLKRLGLELHALSRVTCPSKVQIEEFDHKVEAYGRALRSLGGDIPKDVRQALQAAASPGGAPIDLFCPDVVAWLSERGVVASFRVIAKSAP